MNQTDFAKSIGMSYRNYQERLKGDQPNWKLSELICLAKLEKDVEVDFDGETYKVNIEQL